MRLPDLKNFGTRVRDRDQRGAALVEFAIAIPIFIGLVLVIFDAGLGFNTARSTSAAVRSSARVAALAGDERLADYNALQTLKLDFGNGENVNTIFIYRSEPGVGNGAPPASCTAATACNQYPGSILGSLQLSDFDQVEPDATDPTIDTCSASSRDAAWCPLGRSADKGDFLGVYVESELLKDGSGVLATDGITHADRSIFPLFFPEEIATPVAP